MFNVEASLGKGHSQWKCFCPCQYIKVLQLEHVIGNKHIVYVFGTCTRLSLRSWWSNVFFFPLTVWMAWDDDSALKGRGSVLQISWAVSGGFLQIFNRNLFWHTAVLAAIIQVSRSLIAEEFQNFDPEGVMRQIAYHTHYMPKHWRGAENSDRVRREFEALFQVCHISLPRLFVASEQ